MTGCPEPTTAAWRTSTFSGSGGNCVEVAPLGADRAAVRNSNAPDAGTLLIPAAALAAFVAGARAGEFDDLAAPVP